MGLLEKLKIVEKIKPMRQFDTYSHHIVYNIYYLKAFGPIFVEKC